VVGTADHATVRIGANLSLDAAGQWGTVGDYLTVTCCGQQRRRAGKNYDQIAFRAP
jgi:hypothetical protein